ncbi:MULTISPECIES: ParB/RepB/Spo0J family partition protein [unclassified Enterococcus]|uniref:ParB/RepB/Spo0J family partition protein n=1 Tax=unclassified Enterococcus TaxID=2608891 RepID=UPI00155489DA|nr:MULTISPECIES: ParB/RepB/Spo0J family partition protein [unclassified Enterococcus]MBS7576922.1 ParB/RepB/Spo0J family partition protein [Enterococcus sp. MMGLQ5-2]MBS7584329.1 ParB/RepB/Spo0J family partition protein [Enterococcus sp. MMGLQ5-1]NPD12185.1 ParB/RepB/Spo0J family partition protein [Enterococcus sp. MMGLQ5-1]NPD36757.1 ParB/RepB/Spo0J family partition protein [Enterococcus sp. MMGLQ5-2]
MKNEKMIILPLSEIRANPNQPRTHFDENELKSLAQSIKSIGLIQPIIVQSSSLFGYEIVAGERRFRASALAGLSEIPAIIRDFTADQVETVALLENIQRQDLNPIEEALAYQNIIKNQELTQEQLAEIVGKSRTYLTNMLRLLSLPEKIQDAVKDQRLSNVQARTLLGIKDKQAQLELAERAIAEGLTVRQLEQIVRQITKKTTVPSLDKNLFISDVEEKLKQYFGTIVKIKGNESKGKIELDYADLDELNRILELLGISEEA